MDNRVIPYICTFLSGLLLIAATPKTGCGQQTASAGSQNKIQISLFNGSDLYGWKAENDDADWTATDGEIRVTRGPAGLLRTTSQFDNFILDLEFWLTPDTNSGVFLRTSPNPGKPGVDCYELNLAPANPFPTGSFVGQAKTDISFATNRWHHLRLIADNESVRALIDGKETARVRAGPRGRGYIGLQKNRGEVRFRNIQLRPLELQTLGPGNWESAGLGPATAEWNAEVLQLRGGNGQYETKQRFGDFLFSTSFNTATNTNSGLFFRCIPGDKMMGYESQIQNTEADSKKLEWPTGSIFRRQKARPSTAVDNRWNDLFIAVTGPHIAVWVNGEQVTDWTDRRKPNANPRRGLRLAPGTIILQGHDPQTEIKFRDLRVRELGKRKRG